MSSSGSDPFRSLRDTGEDLPHGVEQEILALGPSAATRLLEIAERPRAYPDEACWDRAHAIRLLARLRCPETYPRLLRLFADQSRATSEIVEWVACVDYLPAIGSDLVAAAFEMIRREPELGDALVYILARVDSPEDRVIALMTDFCDRHPNDANALINEPTSVQTALAVRVLEKLGPDDFSTGLDLAQRLVEVGGRIPEHLGAKIADWQSRDPFGWTDRLTACAGGPRGCPCGSGEPWETCGCGLSLAPRG